MSISNELLTDLSRAFMLVLVIEGILYMAAPDMMRKLMAMALQSPVMQLRATGFTMAIIGVLLLMWLR